MNAVPARQRGAAAGMRATFTNSGTVISIGVFFSLMVAGLANSLPGTLYQGPRFARRARMGSPRQISNLPPVSSLFGALLGYNPMASLLPASVLEALPVAQANILTGKTFFRPHRRTIPAGLTIVFVAAALMAVGAAIASWLRGGSSSSR